MTHLKNAQRVAKLLDSQFNILGFKFGLEPIIGLVPGLGDAITLLLSLYLFYIALEMKLPKAALVQMLINIGVDFFVGTVPVVGDIIDFFYQANSKNLQIIEKYSGIEEGKVIKE
jgi:hypothetical protein